MATAQKADSVSTSWRLASLTKGVRGRIALAALCGLGAVTTGVARLSLSGTAVAMVFEQQPFMEILLILLGVLALPMLRIVFTMAQQFIAHETAAKMKVKLRTAVYRHLLRLGPGFTQKQRTGEVVVKAVDSVEQLETFFGRYLPQLVVAGIAPVGILTFMTILDWQSALIYLLFAVLTYVAPTFFRRATYRASRGRWQANRELSADFIDAVQGLATLKIFGRSTEWGRMLAKRARALSTQTMKVLGINIAAGGVSMLFMSLGAATVLAWGAVRVDQGVLGLTPLMIVLFLGVEIFRPLRELNQLYHTGLLGTSSAIGMLSLLDEKPEVLDAADRAAGDGNTAMAAVSEATLEPSVEFAGITFTYEQGDRPALEDVSFAVPAGSTLGIVGPSGAGKTTVTNLLLRFFDPQEGRILLGGHDLRDIPLDLLRQQVSIVAQDTYLFHGTVLENIRLARPDASDEEVLAAAQAANAHRIHSKTPFRLRHDHWRAGTKALRRPTAAFGHRAGYSQRRANPHSRRGHLPRGQRQRSGDPRGAGASHAKPHDNRHRASSFHGGRGRSNHRAGRGRVRRTRLPQRPHGVRRHLRASRGGAVAAAGRHGKRRGRRSIRFRRQRTGIPFRPPRWKA